MKVREQYTDSKPRVYERVTETVCDLCGARNTGDDWNPRPYDTADTTVQWEYGTCFPDGGDKTVVSFDLCPECFDRRLIPWLREQGAEPRVVETDW